MNEELVYIKTKNGYILKCYLSEQMHKPIYHPVNSKTNGYVDYNDVDKKLDIEDMYLTVKELQQENENLRATIKNDDVAVNNLCKEIKNLKQKLKDKDEKISKVKEYCLVEREDINGSKCDNILEIFINKED